MVEGRQSRAKPYVPPKRADGGEALPAPSGSRASTFANEWLLGYVPGIQPQNISICDHKAAKLIPAGSDLVFEMHYTPNGKAGADQTKVGFVLAKEPPEYRLLTVPVADADFAIPPGDANYAGHAEAHVRSAGDS